MWRMPTNKCYMNIQLQVRTPAKYIGFQKRQKGIFVRRQRFPQNKTRSILLAGGHRNQETK